MRTHLLGFPTALGLPRPVTKHAPAALRRLGLIQSLQRQGFDVADLGDIAVGEANAQDPVDLRVRKVMVAAERQARAFVAAADHDSLPITLGGDHSTSLGTALALHRLGHRFDIVWIDAHADFNTVESSPSGNPHGMVLAILAGLTDYLPTTVEPSRLHIWGGRDIDPGEQRLLAQHGVQVCDAPATRAHWQQLLDTLAPQVFLSFDCDSCEPDVAPGTMTPVQGGFTRDEALRMVTEIGERRELLALDIVELHPDRDHDDRTAHLAHDVVLAVTRAQAKYRAAATHAFVH